MGLVMTPISTTRNSTMHIHKKLENIMAY
jgi:hypothetical protein